MEKLGPHMKQKEVLFVVSYTGYQPIEYSVPKKILQEAGYTVTTASNKPGIAHSENDETSTPVDITINKVKVNQYEGIFFIGGPGALENLDNTASYKLIKQAFNHHKVIGAICIATRILAKSDILEGKKATGWDGDNELADLYKQHLSEYIREDVVVDGSIITATGPTVAEQFGQTCVIVLQGQSSWG
jgi:protease I